MSIYLRCKLLTRSLSSSALTGSLRASKVENVKTVLPPPGLATQTPSVSDEPLPAWYGPLQLFNKQESQTERKSSFRRYKQEPAMTLKR
jgi:hypothetical protein